MRASIEWIREVLPKLKASPDSIQKHLTEAGIEVEGSESQAAALQGVVVGEVRRLERHPQADKLQIATVFDGEVEHVVVCGAPNVAEGQRVALARVGTVLPGGLKITERELRGVKSAGMLCSEKELGLSEDGSGILVLGARAKPGKPVASAVGRTDVILEISAPANRPDILSHLGLARELAALYRLDPPVVSSKVKESGGEAEDRARIEIKAGQRCPRYVARVIEGVKIGPSPAEVIQRLEAVGLRSISNVVDATNLVLLELGHPLHAFDLDRLKDQKIVVRLAKEGEELTTLDGVKRKLDPDDLVIADAEVPVALAGVMGGGDSEVSEGTTRILLESAMFDAKSVRRTGKRHGLHTEASHRFERGADPEALERALDRCAQLITELAGGRVLSGRVAAVKHVPPRRVVPVRPARATAILGRPVDRSEIRATLTALGLKKVSKPAKDDKPARGKKPKGPPPDAMLFEVPSWRVDLHSEIDLIEEVARLSGYGSIPTLMPPLPSSAWTEAPKQDDAERVRDTLVSLGFRETISLAFSARQQLTDLGLDTAQAVEVANPLGEESGVMRMSVLPALLRAARLNQSVLRTDLRLFEIGNVFEWTVPPEELPKETLELGLVLRGRRSAPGWSSRPDLVDVFDLKGVLEPLLETFHVRGVRFSPDDTPWLHPRAGGRIEGNGAIIGRFGELHPDVVKRFDLEGPPVFVAELVLPALFSARGAQPVFRPLARFPAVGRDLSFFVDREIAAASILELVRSAAGQELENVEVFDVYEGSGVPQGRRSLAVTLSFRAPERTLTDAEVDAAQQAVIEALESKLSAEVRKS